MNKGSPASMPIVKILGLLTPGQAWSFAAALVALVSGAFTVGLKISNYEVTTLQRKVDSENIRMTFFEAYARYLIDSQMDYNTISHPGSSTDEAIERLADVIAPWYYRPPNTTGTDKPPVDHSPVISKGFDGVHDSHVTFAEGDKWPIPGAVKEVVLQRPPPAR
jgi:hypothetical protein